MPALRSVNKVIIVGNLTRKPELRYTNSGVPVCVFTVATNRAWKNARNERHEEASFHRINAWGKFGENLAKILDKGTKVYVEGILTYREVRDESGKLKYRDARIRAESVVILVRSKVSKDNIDAELAASQGDTYLKSGNNSSSGSTNSSDDNDTNVLDLDDIAQDLESSTTDESEEIKGDGEDTDDLPF